MDKLNRRRLLTRLLTTWAGAACLGPTLLSAQTIDQRDQTKNLAEGRTQDKSQKPAQPHLTAANPPAGQPWPAMTQEYIDSADGCPIFCRRAGTGPLTVVFVHGWSCNHRFFGPQYAPLSQSHAVLTLDLAGHGQSGSRNNHSVEGFADDVMAVSARTEGPIALVVHSAGGRVACQLAHRMGQRLIGIIGIDSFQNLGLAAPDADRIATHLDALRANFAATVERSLAFLLPPETSPEMAAWIHHQMTASDPGQAIAASAAYARFDGAKAIAGLNKPVIALNSDGVPTNRDVIRQWLPRFDTHILPGQGHFPHLTNPYSFNPLLLSTLNQLVADQSIRRSQ